MYLESATERSAIAPKLCFRSIIPQGSIANRCILLQVCVLVVGLDNSGKSTVVNCLKVSRHCVAWLVCESHQAANKVLLLARLRPDHAYILQPKASQAQEMAPTVGFSVEQVNRG